MKAKEVFELVKKIPAGKVTTYGAIARALGSPRGSRLVGQILHGNKEPIVVPCHRVVFADGSLTSAFAFGDGVQREWLESEGVTFIGDKVNMEKHFMSFGTGHDEAE